MRTLLAFTGFALLSACGDVSVPEPEGEILAEGLPKVVRADHPGRVIFERQCAPCHGTTPGGDGTPMLPATMTLASKYEGALPAPLELRDDLGADAIRLFVRQGSGAMPMFRKAELSDADIDRIAGYIAATAQASRLAE